MVKPKIKSVDQVQSLATLSLDFSYRIKLDLKSWKESGYPTKKPISIKIQKNRKCFNVSLLLFFCLSCHKTSSQLYFSKFVNNFNKRLAPKKSF